MNKDQYRYKKDKEIVFSSSSNALKEKIDSNAISGRGAMKKMRDRDWQENGDLRIQALEEQRRLKQKRIDDKRFHKFNKDMPYELRKDWSEKMKHLRSI